MSEKSVFMLKSLHDAVDKLAVVAEDLSNKVEPFNLGFESEDLMANVKYYAILDYLLKVTTELQRIANTVEPLTAERITKHMLQQEMETLTYAGYTYSPDQKVFVSCNKDNMPILINLFKRNEKTAELVKESIHPKTLEAYVKSEIEEGREASLPKIISVCQKPTLTKRKVRGS